MVRETVILSRAPIRGNLRFSPPPPPTNDSSKTGKTNPSNGRKITTSTPKRIPTIKRRSMTGIKPPRVARKAAPARSSRSRKPIEADEVDDEDSDKGDVDEANSTDVPIPDEMDEDVDIESISDDKVIETVPEEDEQEPMLERELESEPEPEPEPVVEELPTKPKRARVAKAKVEREVKPKSVPTRRAPPRNRKAAAPNPPEEEVSEVDEKIPVLPKTKRTVAKSSQKTATEIPDLLDFAKLKGARVINQSLTSKTITFQAKYNNETAVIRLEKTLFDEAAMKKALTSKGLAPSRDFYNDVYSSYMITPPSSVEALCNVKATVICPANETVLAKYSQAETIFFSETPDAYLKVVEPFIENKVTNERDYNKWVFNILDGVSEAERVIYDDPEPDSGFMLVPDLKWTGDEKDLNLIAICHRRDVRSLRDLNDKHLILLKNILTKGTKAIKDKYKKIVKGHIRSYIHYHPSFYHFHVHFKLIDPADYQSTDRDHLLSTVINNISLNKDYYKKSTLSYPLSQGQALFQELKKAKRI